MTTLFSSYKECESVIIQMCNYNDNINLDRLTLAINVCQSLQDDKEKIWRLSQTFLKTLWNNDDAIRKGFHSYFKEKAEKIKQMLDYHEKECPQSNCKVCIHEKNIKEKMVKIYERKRPKIYSQ
jgi:cell division protein ZapA (FtsZ GTPase activity inhibitor)